MRSRGGGTGGSAGRALALMVAGNAGFRATSGNNATVRIGNTTWNFTMMTVSPFVPFSPQREARSKQPVFACAPLEQQQHVPCFCISREQQHCCAARGRTKVACEIGKSACTSKNAASNSRTTTQLNRGYLTPVSVLLRNAREVQYESLRRERAAVPHESHPSPCAITHAPPPRSARRPLQRACRASIRNPSCARNISRRPARRPRAGQWFRSEEHTSELQ